LADGFLAVFAALLGRWVIPACKPLPNWRLRTEPLTIMEDGALARNVKSWRAFHF
jgi:hypothetical protein